MNYYDITSPYVTISVFFRVASEQRVRYLLRLARRGEHNVRGVYIIR